MNLERPALVEHERKHFPGKHALEFGFEDGPSSRRSEYIKFLERAVNDEGNYIDKGGAGEVYSLANGRICIKLMQEREHADFVDDFGQEMKYNLGNSVMAEAWFNERLSDFEVEGVRSPALVEYLEGPKYAAIVMERLNAVNLQHVLNGTASLPPGFDAEDFLERLESYIYELHDTQDVLHGDLEPRNIMIDIQTGNPRVIDFGRSKYLAKLPKEERARLEKSEREKREEIEKKLRQFIRKQ